MDQSLALEMIAYLAAAVISVPIFHRLGLGSILGYLCAGAAIGPFGLHLAGSKSDEIMTVAEPGIVMMLFLIGLELQPKTLWKMRNALVGLGGLQVLATATVLAVGCYALGLSPIQGIAVGLILAMSSTAVALPSLQERNLLKTPGGEASLAVLLSQDIAVIPVIALLPILSSWMHHSGVVVAAPASDTEPYTLHTLVIIGAVAAIVVGGRLLVRPIFQFIAVTHLQEIFTATALLIVIGIILLMDKVGLDSALGAFLGGIVLADSEFKHQIEADIAPFKGLLLGIFFVAVGAGVKFGDLIHRPLFISELVIGLVALKFAVLFLVGRLFSLSRSSSFLFAFALAQGDEFAFVLLPTSYKLGLIGSEWTNALTLTTALSMVLTPFLLLFNENVVQPRFSESEEKLPKREHDPVHVSNEVLLIGFGRFGNVVGRFIRASGIPITVIDHDAEQVETVRKLGLKIYYGDGTRLDILRAAGAQEAKLILVLLDEEEACYKVVEHVQKHFPQAKLLARAVDRAHAYGLLKRKVTLFAHETVGSAIYLSVAALKEMGFSAEKTTKLAQTFQELEYKAIRDLAFAPEGEQFIRRAKEHITNLQKAFAAKVDLSQVE